MTVSSTLRKSRQEGNNSTTEFSANIKIFAKTDITVQILTRTTGAIEKTLILDDAGANGYTVAFTDQSLTVTCVTAPTTTQDIFILRTLDLVQSTTFPEASKFPAASVENAFDRDVLILQDQQEEVDRGLRFAATSTFSLAEIADPEDGKLLSWSSGNIVNTALADISSEMDTVFASLASGDFLTYNGAQWVNTAKNSISITGGTITGITDLAVADGGTGASTASGARTNLDVYSTSEVDALIPSGSIIPKLIAVINGTGTPAVTHQVGEQTISSITDNGTGNYTLNFGSNFADTEYYVQMTCKAVGTATNQGALASLYATSPKAVGSLRIQVYQFSATPSFVDSDEIVVTIWGDLA